VSDTTHKLVSVAADLSQDIHFINISVFISSVGSSNWETYYNSVRFPQESAAGVETRLRAGLSRNCLWFCFRQR